MPYDSLTVGLHCWFLCPILDAFDVVFVFTLLSISSVNVIFGIGTF